MKHDFRTISLIDLNLPPEQKERLWKEKLVSNSALIHVMSVISQNFIATPKEAETLVSDILEISKVAQTYASDFFSYRGDTIPAESLYALAGNVYIESERDKFSYIPDGYDSLSRDLKILDKRSDAISDVLISPQSKFCHYIEKYLELKHLRRSFRDGSTLATSLKPEHTYNEGRYNDVCPHVKNDYKTGPRIVEDSRIITQDIDYILNHYNDDFASYVPLGVEVGEAISDPDFLFSKTNLPRTPRIQSAFTAIYEHYKAQTDDPFSAYYTFNEKVLCPLSLFTSSYPEGLSELSIVYATGSHAIHTSPDPLSFAASLGDDATTLYKALSTKGHSEIKFKDREKSLSVLHSIIDSTELADLVFSTMRMWGSRKTPFLFATQLDDLYAKLGKSEQWQLQGPLADECFTKYKDIAASVYNILAEQNKSLAYPLYSPPSPH